MFNLNSVTQRITLWKRVSWSIISKSLNYNTKEARYVCNIYLWFFYMNWSCWRTLVCLLVLSDLSTYFILFGHGCLTFSLPLVVLCLWFFSSSSLVLFLPPCSFFLIFPGSFLSGRCLNFNSFLNSFLSLFLFCTVSLGFSFYSCGFKYLLDTTLKSVHLT